MHELFWNWFSKAPVICQEKLARIAWLLITDDMSDMALSSEEILAKFKAYVFSIDIPLRKAAKILMIISLFDSIMANLEDFLEVSTYFFENTESEKKLISIENKMWEKIKNSWPKVKDKYYTANLISLTLKELISSHRRIL